MQVVQLPLTRKYVFSLALPVAAMAAAIWFYCSGWSLVITAPGVCLNMSSYLFLVPGFAFWFLFKRACDLRVWLWLSAISFVLGWAVIPVCAMTVVILSLHKWLRMAGLILLIPLFLLGVSSFALGLYRSTSKIFDEKVWRCGELLELKEGCPYNVYIHHENPGMLNVETDEVRVERKIAPSLALRKTVYSKEFGWIDNLKMLDAHTIRFDVFTDPRYCSEDAGFIPKQIKID